MKKWSLLVILSVLLVATVIPVSAAGNGPRSSVFTFVGNITAIGPDYIPGHAHSDTLNFLIYQNGIPFLGIPKSAPE